MTDTPSQIEWRERIEPQLGTSLRKVQETITNERSMQSWIRSASYEAAMSIERPGDVQAQSSAYRNLLKELRETFPQLRAVVNELTEGCGRLDINWRPLSPEYTAIYIDFGMSFPLHIFYKMKAASPDEAQRALDQLSEVLPSSEPFPRRPNKAGAVVSLDDQCLGMQLFDHHPSDEKPRRTVQLHPTGKEPSPHIALADAPARLTQVLSRSEGRISPDEWLPP